MNLTAEQKAAKQAEGVANGAYSCPVCGDSHWWKHFHETPYFEGEMQPSGPDTAKFHGTLSMSALCEDCFGKLTPEQRLPHYLKRFEARIAGVPSVLKKPGVGGMVDDPADKRRHEAQIAGLVAESEAVKAAVLAGK